ncbi:MAG TPA: sigma-54 dependent transcriptional regulator [Ignavibacteriaceae bacterium]|nr:sigma-54-dependent Fis family transcriptional regulator [Ignavibacterium sp.]HMN24636.1 sigma-54 dependent transcriptional regulator [Ignavibacteriaceae bacterium]
MTREEFKTKNEIIGKSKEINDLVDIIMQVAQSDISVLINGESGVGKDVFAKAIHNFSNRSDKPMMAVNCGAIPEGIIESELFGHKKGSFTGAVESRKGYFEIADGGTLFLDEIGELPLTMQVKLLRAIETKEFMKVGSETVSKVDVRIIAATNKDLQREVDARRFREDLFFRLKAVSINIPPLRKRKNDIEELAKHFAKNYCENNNIELPLITDGAIEILNHYTWPGNIRELKNTIETAIALNRGKVLSEEMFTELRSDYVDFDERRNLPVFLRKSPEDADRELMYRALFEIKKDIMELKDIITHRFNVEDYNRKENADDVLSIRELEKDAIVKALDKTKGSKRKAARLLNISERTLYRKLKEYDITE